MRRKVVVLDYGSGNLRSAERALARAGADVTVTADRRGAGGRRAGRAGRRRVRRLHGGLRAVARRPDHRPPARRRPPGAGHLRRHAGAVRPRRRARRRDRGLRRVARHGRAAAGRRRARTWAGTPSTPRRAPGCSPAWTPTPASTSCTPTPSAAGTLETRQPAIARAAGDLGDARRAVRGRGGERRRCGPPSSTPRSPATPGARSCSTNWLGTLQSS